jgi:hypothetical protein
MHLLGALRKLYTVTKDWPGTLFSGLTISWNYEQKYVDISMPHYIPAMLHKFQHARPTKHQGGPHTWTTPSYGTKVQYAPSDDDSPILSPSDITTIQQKIGTLLYHAISVDLIMLAALGSIASSQAKATQLTEDECSWLMNYAASNPLSIIRYCASNMTLYVHSDASYLSETHARSRGAGHFFLSSRPKDPTAPPEVMPTRVHTMCKIIDVVVGLAAEAKIVAGYLNSQDALSPRSPNLVTRNHRPQCKLTTPQPKVLLTAR